MTQALYAHMNNKTIKKKTEMGFTGVLGKEVTNLTLNILSEVFMEYPCRDFFCH
jgi:hypothetical protein